MVLGLLPHKKDTNKSNSPCRLCKEYVTLRFLSYLMSSLSECPYKKSIQKNSIKEVKMKVKIIGKRSGSFTDKKTGELVSFGKMSCITPFPLDQKDSEGEQALEVSVRPDVLVNVPVPSDAELDFNQNGSLIGINLL